MIFDQLDFKEEKVMDNEKIEKLQQMIDESDHIVFFGGAGVSTRGYGKPYILYTAYGRIL